MWRVVDTQHHGLHVLPDGDTLSHYADGLCLCIPTRHYVPGAFTLGGGWTTTHNAWDGREARERIEDKKLPTDERADTLMAWQLGEMV